MVHSHLHKFLCPHIVPPAVTGGGAHAGLEQSAAEVSLLLHHMAAFGNDESTI